MNQVDASLLIAGVGFVLSIMGSLIVGSFRGGRIYQKMIGMEAKLENTATTADMHGMENRLSRIEGMFELTLRKSGSSDG